MSKYIDADRLSAEIERLLGVTETHRGEAVADGSRQTLYWIKDFIDTLQQEQPKGNVEKVCGTCTYWQEGTLDRGMCQAGEPHQTHSAETCERWERHEEIPLGEQPSEDLEEAASSFAWEKEQPLADGERLSYTFKPRIEAFKAGAEWQKSQMLKDAVEGIVVGVYPLKRATEIQYGVLYPKGVLPHKNSDKVKIVIVPIKEDKK